MRKLTRFSWIVLFINLASAPTSATVVDIEASVVTWTAEAKSVLRVTGPAGFVLAEKLAADEVFELMPLDESNSLADGLYRWNLVASPSYSDGESRQVNKSASGYFTVADGVFVPSSIDKTSTEEEVEVETYNADGFCSGTACTVGERIEDGGIRQKGKNLSLLFLDTSQGTSPSNDWQITLNESMSGGADKFSIDDLGDDGQDAMSTPFTLEAGAPDHSIYLDTEGRLGLGTNTPLADLHVYRADGEARLLIQEESEVIEPRELLTARNNGTTRISLTDTSISSPSIPQQKWSMVVQGSDSAFAINAQGSGTTDLILYRADAPIHPGRLQISGPIVTGGGACRFGCDALFQSEIESIEEHADYMWKNSHLPAIGPTSPNEPWNLTEKTSGILTELEKAHIYIDQLNQTIGLLQQDKSKLSERLDGLLKRIEKLEATRSE